MSYDLQLSNGDIVVDTQGDVIVVEDYDKLYQDMLRLMLTSPGQNHFDTVEGCGVYDLLGRVIPRDINETLLSKQVYQGLQHMLEQQVNQSLVQYVSPYEQIATIDALVIRKMDIKEMSFEVFITTVRGLQTAFVYNVK